MKAQGRDKFRNSDIIFFGTMISMLILLIADILLVGTNLLLIEFWWFILLPIAIAKMFYIMGNRNKYLVKFTNWLESTNNPIDRWIEKKLNESNYYNQIKK